MQGNKDVEAGTSGSVHTDVYVYVPVTSRSPFSHCRLSGSFGVLHENTTMFCFWLELSIAHPLCLINQIVAGFIRNGTRFLRSSSFAAIAPKGIDGAVPTSSQYSLSAPAVV